MSVKKWFCKKEKNRKLSVPSDVVVTVILADPYEIMIPFYTSLKTSEKTQIICDVLREYMSVGMFSPASVGRSLLN